jgi:MFS family permease
MHVLTVRPQPCASAARNPVRELIAKIGMFIAGFVAVANISAIYLALPALEDGLHVTPHEQQWIVGIYPLMEGGFALAAGTLGDLYGRKRVLVVATWIFLIASLLCAFAPNPLFLIGARALQGVASAALLSLPIAILVQMLSDPADSADTIGLYTLVVGVAAGATPLIAGLLVQWFSWRGIFFFSAALAVLVLIGLAATDESTCDPEQHPNFVGQALSILALLAISFVVINVRAGFTRELLFSALGVSVIAVALFWLIERRSAHPMLRFERFDRRRFYVSVLTLGIVNFGWYGLLLLCTLLMRRVMGQGPFEVGLYLTPSSIAFFIANAYSTKIVRRSGIAVAAGLSFALSLGGIAWLALLPDGAAPWQVAAALVVTGSGWGLICTPATALGMSSVGLRDEGFASAALVLSRSLFGVFGVAVLGTLLDSYLVNLERYTDASFLRGVHAASTLCFILTLVFALAIVATLRYRRTGSDANLPVA